MMVVVVGANGYNGCYDPIADRVFSPYTHPVIS